MTSGMGSPSAIEYCGILITEEAVIELDGQQAAQVIPWSQIRAITVRRGIQAPRPLLQTGLGLILLAVGLAPIPLVIEWLMYGGVMPSCVILLMINSVFGAWVIYEGLRRGYYLAVQDGATRRKLMFSRQARLSQLREFLAEAERLFGHGVLIQGDQTRY